MVRHIIITVFQISMFLLSLLILKHRKAVFRFSEKHEFSQAIIYNLQQYVFLGLKHFLLTVSFISFPFLSTPFCYFPFPFLSFYLKKKSILVK